MSNIISCENKTSIIRILSIRVYCDNKLTEKQLENKIVEVMLVSSEEKNENTRNNKYRKKEISMSI